MSFSRFSRRAISAACASVNRSLIEPLEARRLLAGNGLQAEYFNGKDFNTHVVTRTDATVDFDWGFGSPAAGVNGNFFSARWTGKIAPPATGNYTFYTQSDDGIRVWVNGQQIINNWTDHAATENSGSITLTGGQLYDIRVEYYEGINNALARLSWAGPGISKQVVPASALFTPDTTGPVEPDPELPALNLSAVIATVNEDPADTSALILTRSGPTSEALTVTINRTGTATNGVDYSFPATMTFAPGATVVRVPFVSIADTLVEGNEFVTFSIAPSSAYVIETGTATITIVDNDAPPVGDESGLKAEYFNGRSFNTKIVERTDAQINFDWGYGSPVAGAGADNFSVRWTGQVLAQAPSTGIYTFYTTSDDGVRLWVNGVQLIDQWNDHAPTEHSGSIQLVAGQKYDIRMEYYEAGNGAVAQLRWSGAGISKQVVPANALFSSTTPTPVLPTVAITSSDSQGAEQGQDPVSFTITRTGSMGSALTVPIVYSGDASAADFTSALPSSVTIPADQTSVTVTLTPVDDAIVEGFNTLTVAPAPNAGYTIGAQASVTLTISDNDMAPVLPTVTITSADPHGAETWDYLSFTLARTGSTAEPLTVHLTYGGTATENDFAANNRPRASATIPAGQSSVTAILVPIQDANVEIVETLIPTIVSSETYNIGGTGSVMLYIWDETQEINGLKAEYFNGRNFNDKVIERIDTSINFDWGYNSPASGVGADNFSVRWTGQVQTPTTGSYTFYTTSDDGVRLWVNGIQILGQWNDHAPAEHSGSILLTAGERYDIRMEYYEAGNGAVAQLRWAGPGVAKQIVPASALFSPIASGPVLPTVMITSSDTEADEDTGDSAEVTITRTGSLDEPLEITLDYSGTATRDDFINAPTSILLPTGVASKTIELKPRHDVDRELLEHLIVSISPQSTYVAGSNSSVTISIVDREIPIVELRARGSLLRENGTQFRAFSVMRNASYPFPTTVHLAYGGTAGQSDFSEPLPTSITIPANVDRVEISLPVFDDTEVEGPEYLEVSIIPDDAYRPAYNEPYRSISITVRDDDVPEIGLSKPNQVVVEGRGSVTFQVTRIGSSAVLANETVVFLNYAGDVSPEDFVEGLPASVTIPAGATSADFTFTPIDDEIYEGREQLTITVAESPGYYVDAGPGSAFIEDAGGIREGWWDVQWQDRIRVAFSAGVHTRNNYVLNRELSLPAATDMESVRVVEISADGLAVLNDNVPYQFDDTIADYSGNGVIYATIYILADGTTDAGQQRYYHIYYDAHNSSLPAHQIDPLVTLTTDASDEGQAAFKINTPTATYFYQKENGGLSSLLDADGNDWINFSPVAGSGSAGEFRGIPNAVFPGGGFHPGFVNAESRVTDSGPLHVQITTSALISRNGEDEHWTFIWEFYPDHTLVTVDNLDRKPYWFLYEGTPGGSIDANDFVVRSDGTRTPISQSWREAEGVGSDTGNRWLYFADDNLDRYLFMGRSTGTRQVDSYYLMDNNMTVFGFGRDEGNAYMTDRVQTFVLGIGDGTDYEDASANISGIYKFTDIPFTNPSEYYMV